MSKPFNPYIDWLGIPENQLPPTHYRLLGVETFETNTTAISNAADRVMLFIRTFQMGQHSDESQRILNEIAAARVCLLNPEKKAEYDESLREKNVDASPSWRRTPPPPASAVTPIHVTEVPVTPVLFTPTIVTPTSVPATKTPEVAPLPPPKVPVQPEEPAFQRFAAETKKPASVSPRPQQKQTNHPRYEWWFVAGSVVMLIIYGIYRTSDNPGKTVAKTPPAVIADEKVEKEDQAENLISIQEAADSMGDIFVRKTKPTSADVPDKKNTEKVSVKMDDDFLDDSLNLEAHLRKAGVELDGELLEDEEDEDISPAVTAVSEKRLSPPTPAETRMNWDAWLRRQAREKMGIYQQVPLQVEGVMPGRNDSVPVQSHAVSRQDVRTLTKLSAEDMKTLQMNGGYLIFEETAYPFGTFQEEDAGNKPAEAVAPRRSHVLQEDELQEDSLGGVTLKEKKATVDIPGIRYEIPRLGELLGLKAVVVCLESRDDGMMYLVVEGVRRAVTSADRERQENHLAELARKRNELGTLRGHILACETSAKDGTSAKNAEENIRKMLRFLNIDESLLPDVTERPARGDFASQRAYETEVELVRLADEARARVFRNLIVRAKDESTRREEELRILETQIDQVHGRLTPAETSAFSRLIAGCTQINVVFTSTPGD